MRTRITTAIVVVAIMAMAMVLGSRTAHAQCASLSVSNFTSCDIELCLYDAAGNQACITLAAAGNPTSTGFISAFMPVGAISTAKNRYPFSGNPFCTLCIRIPGSHVVTGCCATVCYDVLTCSITVNPCPDHCLP
ncbi:MAG: hypothetical protein JWQ98_2490 [Chlorobi bacterium]|nr:hypothetical protein [Chlorobiota bacterium]